ncbi:hypothetical protein PRUPE_1G459400 [Prunus persica]|uniref:Uncharacterized protein n=1 Tax=Prunus persica TaxID=3760 RepID=M5Y0M2_PRUPE|nr:uncharacterized protein LOC18793319 [Prunus persica]ONI34027.1 hypothetical protein PRUPE_1G459400 [Prunus persica]
MDVLVGPAFSIGDGRGRLFVKQNVEALPRSEEASSDSSSSIGAPDDSEEYDSKGDDGDGDGEEVQSKFNGGGGGGGLGSLGSFGSLEESLPIKRGLSNYFSGKSKSFASLSEVSSSVSSVKEVEKRDNPFNKRRRVLIASKWSRKSSSFYNWPNPKSMPLLALAEHEEDEEDDEQQQEQQEQQDPSSDQSSSDDKEQQDRRAPKNLLDRRLKSFKSRSCYCLSDLQDH